MNRCMIILKGFLVFGLISSTSVFAQTATDLNCDGCVQSSDIATNGVRRSNIQNFSVNTPKLNNFAVTTPKIKPGAVTGDKIADGAVSAAKVSPELSADIGSSCEPGLVVVGKDASGNFVCQDISAGCDPATEVEFGGRCYYLDGSGGVCQGSDELAPQLALEFIASRFLGKDYKTTVSSNCCIEHSKTAAEGQDWGFPFPQCNTPGPFTEAPLEGGAGCTDSNNQTANQLTFCRSL